MANEGLSDILGEGGSGGNEQASEKAQEQFREQMAAAQAAVAQIRAQEKRAKQKDDHLAVLLAKFLMNPKNDRYVLLIAHLLEKDIPSAFILAMLSLIFPESRDGIELPELPEGKNTPSQGEFQNGFPEHLRPSIENWTSLLFNVASANPHRVLETLVDPQTWDPDAVLIQTTTFLVQDFLEQHKVQSEYEKIHAFADLLMRSILKRIEQQVTNQAKLSG